jgi:hypothetical protein
MPAKKKKVTKKRVTKKRVDLEAAIDVARAASRGDLPTLIIPGYRGRPPLSESSEENLVRAASILADEVE